MRILKPKQILIAPLDWGLGHTARCMPIIHYLKQLGHIPIVAGNNSQLSFIKETFPHIDNFHLNGYNITYSKWNRYGQLGILFQLPAIIKKITNEHTWLDKLSGSVHLDGIISDNRYGLFHASVPSVILTHQLQVQSGMGNSIDRSVQTIHYKFLNRFNATWVVDAQGPQNLGGKLSHSLHSPKSTQYLGLLSRFAETEHKSTSNSSLLILLSGPEPQRTAFSQMLWEQAKNHDGSVTFVEGSDKVAPRLAIPEHITYYQRLNDRELAPILSAAGTIICRSGYSTIMDLVALRKKAVLIPTPGQTEQEYLANHLHKMGVFYSTKQDGFNLDRSLKDATSFPWKTPPLDRSFSEYKTVIDQWLTTL